jgi:hypothetical protein
VTKEVTLGRRCATTLEILVPARSTLFSILIVISAIVYYTKHCPNSLCLVLLIHSLHDMHRTIQSLIHCYHSIYVHNTEHMPTMDDTVLNMLAVKSFATSWPTIVITIESHQRYRLSKIIQPFI